MIKKPCKDRKDDSPPLHKPKPPHSSNTTGPSLSTIPGQIQGIQQAIARQSYKSALEKAKRLHKELASPESESVLVVAYIARIEGMIAKEMLVEAKALVDLVASRFPQASEQVMQLQCTLAAKTLDIHTLLEPLAESFSHRQWPQVIQNAVRRQVLDPADLANCTALSHDHPLRKAATATATAFEAATSGPVDEATLALSDVPRRNPLAPWKFLIRGIACLYEGRDEE